MGMTYLLAGDYQKSVQQLQHTIDLDPTFPLAHFFLASALTEIGKYEQAIEEMQRGALLSGASPEQAPAVTAEFLAAFRIGGPNGYWQKNLQATLWQQEHGGREHWRWRVPTREWAIRRSPWNGFRKPKRKGTETSLL